MEIFRILTCADKVLIAILLALTLVGVGFVFSTEERGEAALVEVEGRRAGRFSLHTPRTVEVRGSLGITAVQIDDGYARVVRSPCPHQICVKAGRIKRSGQIVACIPNRVVLRIEGRSDGQVDAVTQ